MWAQMHCLTSGITVISAQGSCRPSGAWQRVNGLKDGRNGTWIRRPTVARSASSPSSGSTAIAASAMLVARSCASAAAAVSSSFLQGAVTIHQPDLARTSNAISKFSQRLWHMHVQIPASKPTKRTVSGQGVRPSFLTAAAPPRHLPRHLTPPCRSPRTRRRPAGHRHRLHHLNRTPPRRQLT